MYSSSCVLTTVRSSNPYSLPLISLFNAFLDITLIGSGWNKFRSWPDEWTRSTDLSRDLQLVSMANQNASLNCMSESIQFTVHGDADTANREAQRACGTACHVRAGCLAWMLVERHARQEAAPQPTLFICSLEASWVGVQSLFRNSVKFQFRSLFS